MFEHYKPKAEKPLQYEYKEITKEELETLPNEELLDRLQENLNALEEMQQSIDEFNNSYVDVGAFIFRFIFILCPFMMLVLYILSNVLGLNPFYEILIGMIIMFIGMLIIID